MPRRVRLAACLGALAVLSSGALALLSCAGDPRVDFDPTHDFQRAQSWDWLPPDAETPPLASDAELRDQVSASIETELARRGLVRSGVPDLYVACQIALTHEQLLRTVTPAEQHLPSLHQGSPSFDISATERQLVDYEHVLLRIEVRDAVSRQVVWSAVVERRVRGRFAPHADRAVAELLAGFPPPPPAREARAGTNDLRA